MDDFAFGNVWGDPPPKPAPLDAAPLSSLGPSAAASETLGGDFDDFEDDFSQPQAHVASFGDDDDFGDFGDFGGDIGTSTGAFQDEAGFGGQPILHLSQQDALIDWEPLHLHPLPETQDLTEQVNDLLDSLVDDAALGHYMTNEGIREVDGVAQVLVTPESRSLYDTLLESRPPPTRPINWTRSRTRRQHLIALGIPVNLDEVLPHANGKPLPALQIITRPASAPPAQRPPPHTKLHSGSNTRVGTPRVGSPQTSQPLQEPVVSSFGPPPTLDQAKISEMLSLTSDTLPLLPLPVLNAHLNTLRSLTVNASAVLTHRLQQREALQQDSETYNALIAELIQGETMKMKTGRKQPAKRGTLK